MRTEQLPLPPLGRALVSCLQRLEPSTPQPVLMLAALCCEALQDGAVCLPVERVAGRAPWPEYDGCLPSLAECLAQLEASPLVSEGQRYTPLVLWQQRLYLARYHAYEANLADQLLRRLQQPQVVDDGVLADSLQRLFATNTQLPDWQRLAAAQAVCQSVTVISGGPGTGKTTTVVRFLAALLEQPREEALVIGLAAPTGKAAARMAEAIRQAKAQLPVSASLKARLPEQALTLHRLLGRWGNRPGGRYHTGNPLPLDVLVVDEASMVDLALMAQLLVALPLHARLILLGDRDQLAAVEAGAVFAELCEGQGFSRSTARRLQQLTGQAVPIREPRSRLGESVVLLSHSHRFAGDSGIGELARRVNAGDVEGVQALLRQAPEDLCWQIEPTLRALLARLEKGYEAYIQQIQTGDPAQIFRCFTRFRVLSAQREGGLGVEALNKELEKRLRWRLGGAVQDLWYPGRPVMIAQNDYALGLFNGDVGICLKTPKGLRVFFETDQGFRDLSPARLPSHECALVMTVHKSQGSEFDQVLLVLPEQPSPLLTRSLLYTGLTRARRQVELWAWPERLAEAVATCTERASGLALRLQWPHQPGEQQTLFPE